MFVDQQGYYTCWYCTKTVMNFFLTKGRELTVNENWHAP
jgi:hypothetical protein